MRVACWINKAICVHAYAYAKARAGARTRTHTDKYVILIAFSRQQPFLERVSKLRYTYIACLVFVRFELDLGIQRTLVLALRD
jgi:hypothetical protein